MSFSMREQIDLVKSKNLMDQGLFQGKETCLECDNVSDMHLPFLVD